MKELREFKYYKIRGNPRFFLMRGNIERIEAYFDMSRTVKKKEPL